VKPSDAVNDDENLKSKEYTQNTYDVEKMLELYVSAWKSHNVETILSFYTPDCILRELRSKTVYRGHQQITRFVKAKFLDCPDLKMQLTLVFGYGDRWCAEVCWFGTYGKLDHNFERSGKFFFDLGIIIFGLKNGKIQTESR